MSEKTSSFSAFLTRWKRQEYTILGSYLLRWILISLAVGLLAGSASALFLWMLNWATATREAHLWLLFFLPVAGFLIGWIYEVAGPYVNLGNNLILQEVQQPSKLVMPVKMAPLVLLATVLTHLVGGSAGREGTAVQMAGALGDQLTPWFRLRPRDRKVLLMCAMSAGFSSVFGTPLAGTVFGLEVVVLGRMRYEALIPCFLAAVVAHGVTSAWGIGHTHYPVVEAPGLTITTFLAVMVAGVCFALAARLFSRLMHFISAQFKTRIKLAPLRPAVGGLLLLVIFWGIGSKDYAGLGVPMIEASFHEQLPPYAFMLKLVLTALTLGCGFKGGEVTPLFFIGATLGNALSLWLPLPMELLAGIGFVAVFAGATNTPLACTFMAMELFGTEIGMYAGLACVISYLFSGHTGIYSAQRVGSSKHLFYGKAEGKRLSEL